ncbi:MAG: dTDP-4-dehydrorhamnose 3,5-epimerase [Alphaproteobacteria bacterium]|nr:dTDP-4-dehydrorhamnose 3,5-epimerase [Alphaproteobacteria bacterium]MBU1561640.1 dTDP-4-dehydrorhamnose 3,5-epimerase [Alphaproteobacteria bacterium]MBU2302379.1 dTDP-4-dehydrorhamnose 3,5-epimerase [Alphaproteobacteria bacterium]MBU2368659.1 dTDP-4-dehydrorhamnose 3,5-epimerase [Alphaproteobacteria bacterium]
MKSASMPLDGLIVLEPRLFADERGAFFESYNANGFADLTGQHHTFVQDNHSISSAGVLRGLHYQLAPREQGKLVRVVRGAIFDVAVDIRADSSTFGRWCGLLLSAENHKQFWIPGGFAHGFLALTDCEVLYKTDAYYEPALERSIHWDDPAIGITWPLNGEPLLSSKDDAAGPLPVTMMVQASGALDGLAR